MYTTGRLRSAHYNYGGGSNSGWRRPAGRRFRARGCCGARFPPFCQINEPSSLFRRRAQLEGTTLPGTNARRRRNGGRSAFLRAFWNSLTRQRIRAPPAASRRSSSAWLPRCARWSGRNVALLRWYSLYLLFFFSLFFFRFGAFRRRTLSRCGCHGRTGLRTSAETNAFFFFFSKSSLLGNKDNQMTFYKNTTMKMIAKERKKR